MHRLFYNMYINSILKINKRYKYRIIKKNEFADNNNIEQAINKYFK